MGFRISGYIYALRQRDEANHGGPTCHGIDLQFRVNALRGLRRLRVFKRFRVEYLGFRVQGLELIIKGLGCKVKDFEFITGLRAQGLGFRV